MPFALSMLVGFAALILVSLLTRSEDPKRVEAFFDKMRRSSDSTGATRPLAADLGQDLLLDAPGWFTRRRWVGGFRRYREDIVGFLLAWISVGVMLLVAWLILQIGR